MTTQNDKLWRGVFAILCTPFHADGSLDLKSLAREVEFCVEGGAHGLVTTVNASESWTLSDAERMSVVEVTARELAGTLPLVVGVSAGSSQVSAELARHAEQSGADAVIAVPTASRLGATTDIVAYFADIAGAVNLPVFVQNHEPPLGTRMTPELVSRIVTEVPGVNWIKEETIPASHAIRAEISLSGDKLAGVMNGQAGRYLMEDYRAGACGTMPACESVDVHVQIWRLLEESKPAEARDVFDRLLPLLNYEALSSGVYKTVLQWRGVIENSYMRNVGGNPLGEYDLTELRHIVDRMSDLFTGYPVK